MNQFNILVLLINELILSLVLNTASTFKLIYQKDVSEHCRRRVLTSVFLGRQVVEADAQLMQFSRLELPYSCFISVRTESGSNMVMMVQVSTEDLGKSCNENRGQLQVYEMGETFGGYWGPLPESVLKLNPQVQKVYTLKTTQATRKVFTTRLEEEESEEEENTEKPSTASKDGRTNDYVEVEVPLLNISVNMVPGKPDLQKSDVVDIDEMFDIRNDATPVAGVSYDTSLLPLVQFHMLKQPGERQADEEPPKYELDIAEQFTPDMRLTLPQLNPTTKRTKSYTQRYLANRRLNFKKHTALSDLNGYFDRQFLSQTITRRINDATKYTFPTYKTYATEYKHKPLRDSWQIVEDLIEKLNKTQSYVADVTNTTLSEIDHIILEKISNMNHNRSVYLSKGLSRSNGGSKLIKTLKKTAATPSIQLRLTMLPYYYTTFNVKNNVKPVTKSHSETTSREKEQKTIRHSFNHETKNSYESRTELYPKSHVEVTNTTIEDTTISQSLNSGTTNSYKPASGLHAQESTIDHKQALQANSTSNIDKAKDIVESNTDNSVTETNLSTFHTAETTSFSESRKEEIDSNNSKSVVTGTMVGHESWENIVQAAPEMAVLLNQTVAYDGNDDATVEFNGTLHKNKLKRKKREIHSIPINNVRPYRSTTRRVRPSPTRPSLAFGDMQEFAQLVELQDDEMHGRVALRYLRKFVGPSLFNLCEFSESGSRHVHLFNSSRIVLAVSNFTLDRMVIILTSARTLLSGESHCPISQLECQVSGARVCLDSMVACDGVPNCGSYDIYDEDRVLCGELLNLKHNVYLAAFTFLAVLMTGLYTVHYWLKRCVPKVADAFFVYTDGSENILYLDTIMRSPNETCDMSKQIYQSNLFDDDNMDDFTKIEVTKESLCKRFLRKLCCCFQKKKKIDELEMYDLLRSSRSLSKRMYSFTELQISKMAPTSTDMSVQTGESLEMNYIEKVKKLSLSKNMENVTEQDEPAPPEFPIMIRDSSLTLDEPLPEEHNDELSLLKFLKDARTDSIVARSKKKNPKNINKMELLSENVVRTHAYETTNDDEQPGPSKEKIPLYYKGVPSSKHLRFDEVTTTIPSSKYDYEDPGDDDVSNVNNDPRRSTAFGESRPPRRARHLDTIDEDDEHSSSPIHRNFWGLPQSKSRKSNKKAHISTLRQ